MINKIKVGPYGSIQKPIDFKLGSLSVIRGQNSAGKSMICHAIMLGLQSRRRWLPAYWCRESSRISTFECWVDGQKPKHLRRQYKVHENKEGVCFYEESEWFLNGQRRSDSGSIEEIIHPIYLSFRQDPDYGYIGDISQARFFEIAASILGYHDADSATSKRAVLEIIEEMNMREDRLFANISCHLGDIIVHEWERDYKVIFSKIGSTNINALLVDFALHVAETYAVSKHSLVILDGHSNMFYPEKCLPMYVRFMDRVRAALSHNLQVLMTTVNPDYHEIINPDATINLVDPFGGIAGTEIESVEFSSTATFKLDDLLANSAAAITDADDAKDEEYTMKHTGSSWTINFLGDEFTVKDHKGARYIAHLLAHPGTVFSASQLKNFLLPKELDRKNSEHSTFTAAESMELSTHENVVRLKKRQQQLESDRECETNQLAVAEIDSELEEVDTELKRILTRSGKIRREGGTLDNDRKSVSNAVHRGIYRETDDVCEPCRKFFEKRIDLGFNCMFFPAKGECWKVKFPKKIM